MGQVPDVIVDGTVVVGLGGIGYHPASRGATGFGLDARPPGHRTGSSQGRTRLVRQAYFEDPAVVPLATRAWRLWHDLEEHPGPHLLTETGVLALAPEGEPRGLVPATLDGARRHGRPPALDIGFLDPGRFRTRAVPDQDEVRAAAGR